MSRRSPRLLAVKKEACDSRGGEDIPMATREEIHHLSKKAPFFDMILTTSYVDSPCQLLLPVAANSMLPSTDVPVVLRHGGKSWMLNYKAASNVGTRPRFDSKWKYFVEDNHLKSGDACVFELIHPSRTMPVFKVHILRGDLPAELRASVDTAPGEAANTPIVIE